MDLAWECTIVFVGIAISGCVTISIIYFAAERHCRRVWPRFFRQGGFEEIRGALKLRLRDRMLVIFDAITMPTQEPFRRLYQKT